MQKSFLIIASLLGFLSRGQVVQVDPPFPNQNDTVTITYDASAGNAALAGIAPVYVHTGVITSAGGPGSWQNVQGNWGSPDPKVLMTDLGNDKHEISFHIPTYYGLSSGMQVQELAFVFRNADGSTVGRTSNGKDIFYPIYPATSSLQAAFFAPQRTQTLNAGDSLEIYAASSQDVDFTIYDNGVSVAQNVAARSIRRKLPAGGPGSHTLVMEADNGSTVLRDTVYYLTNPAVTTAPVPSGMDYGANLQDPTTVTFVLHAPFKNNVYLLGDFNAYQPDTNYFLQRAPNGSDWWITLSGLDPTIPHTYQYLVDGTLRIADPYAELVLDPQNDFYLDSLTFPQLPDYPDALTSGITTYLRTNPPQYNWQNSNFQPRPKDELVIYELLIRDFLQAHNYQALIDTLPYLDQLGINAIELMPVSEFEGNESWGYNPSFHMALDKYYGTPEKFKAFVDSCHGRGMAVILDVVHNHAYGQSPLVQMWFDPSAGQFGQPTSRNPYFNEVPRHDFNVGFDFNHESQATKDYTTQVLKYWLKEYQVDGFRFDLSKGFTQNNTLGNVSAWNAYDQSRVNILNAYKAELETVNPDFYPILEHFSDNNEEKTLADNGFMIWGNMNHSYNQASMGYNTDADFSGVFHSDRNYNFKHLIGFQESHDEERLMYKNLQFGNSNGSYDITQLSTALDRMELNAAFFYTLPGPKMLWQFGELGYDVSITTPCRICSKPIRWNYFAQPDRRDLYQTTSELLHLRERYPVFNTNSYRYDFRNTGKRVNLDGSVNITILGNFGLVSQGISPQFQHTGWWYEYFTGDSINVSDRNAALNLNPGEYRLYSDQVLQSGAPVSTAEPFLASKPSLYPNPAHKTVGVNRSAREILQADVYSLTGAKLQELEPAQEYNGHSFFHLKDLPAGTYFIHLLTNQGLTVHKLIVR